MQFDGEPCSGIDLTSGGDILAPTQGLTVEEWLETTDSTSRIGFRWRFDGYGLFGGASVEFAQYPNITEAPISMDDGKWHFVVATVDPSGTDIYVDGELEATSSVSTWGYEDGGGVAIGRDGSACDGVLPSWLGDIGQVAIYGYALSAANVLSHYEAAGYSPSTPNYVALGDSFSSGEGVPPYFEANNKCDRSTAAYATEVDIPFTGEPFDGAAGYGWGFLACSGATSVDMGKSQVTTKRDKSNTNWLPLSSSTALVTITAGGDDVGWSGVLKFCYKKWANCENDPYPKKNDSSLNTWASNQLSTLEPNLVKLYQAIRKRAPNAQILVLGYPQLLPATTAEQDCGVLQPLVPIGPYRGLDNDEQNWFRVEEVSLNLTIEDAVGKAAVGATFLPVASQFSGHEICGSLGEWINGPSFTIHHFPPIAKNSFHPNQVGQIEYAAIVNQYLTS